MSNRIRLLFSVAACAAFLASGCSMHEQRAEASAESGRRGSARASGEVLRHRRLHRYVSVSGASFAPDESRLLFSSNRSGIWNAYTMPVGGGEWTAVTQSTTDNVYAIGYFFDDARMLVTRDQGGNELNHVYVIEADGRERDLTPGDKLKAAFAGFSHAGDAFYLSSNERDPKFFDLYRYDARTYARELVFRNDAGYELGEISDDGRYIALGKTRTTNDNDLHLFDRDSGKVVHLTPHQGDAQFSAQDFAPDGRFLYYTSNEGSEPARLRRYEFATAPTATCAVRTGISPMSRFRTTASTAST